MQSSKVILAALLVVSNAMAAEAPPKPSMPSADHGERATSKREAQRAATDEEALALAAMEGLMAQPPERALPIIKRVLAGSQTTLIKKRALFVLSQLDTPEAQQILLQTSRSADEALRHEAIRSIGIGGNSQSLAALQDIYKSGDPTVRKQVLEAWMIAGRKQEVYQAALDAGSEAEANQAIRTLAVMGALDELRRLGDHPNADSGLVEAYAISGDLASLRKIAEESDDVSVRTEAVRKIGIIHGDAARTALREIYTGSSDLQIKDAALQGMLIAGDEQGVLALYRAAKTTDEKQALLRTLSMIGGDAALEAIDGALEEKK